MKLDEIDKQEGFNLCLYLHIPLSFMFLTIKVQICIVKRNNISIIDNWHIHRFSKCSVGEHFSEVFHGGIVTVQISLC